VKIIDYGNGYIEVKDHTIKRDKEYYDNLKKQRKQTQEANEIYGFNKCIDEARTFANKIGVNIKNQVLEKRKRDSVYRTRKLFKELLLGNLNTGKAWLVTFTYKIPVFDYKIMLKDYKTFQKRLKRDGYNYYAITVPQVHEGKRLKQSSESSHTKSYHLHAIVFNVPDNLSFNYFAQKWKLGSCNVKPISKVKYENIDKLTNYLTGYLAKENLDKNQKTYFATRNLKRPSVIDGHEAKSIYESLKAVGKPVKDLSKNNSMHGYLTHKYYIT